MQKNTASMQKIFEAWQKLTFCRVDKKGSGMLWNNHFGIHNWQNSLKCLYWILLDRVYPSHFLNFIHLLMRKRWKKSANSSQFLKNPLIMYIYHTIEKSVLNMKLLSCLVWQWLPIYYSTVCVWNTRQVSNLPHFEKNCRPRPYVKEFLTCAITLCESLEI